MEKSSIEQRFFGLFPVGDGSRTMRRLSLPTNKVNPESETKYFLWTGNSAIFFRLSKRAGMAAAGNCNLSRKGEITVKIKSNVKADDGLVTDPKRIVLNHNQTVVRSLKVKSGVKAGGLKIKLTDILVSN